MFDTGTVWYVGAWRAMPGRDGPRKRGFQPLGRLLRYAVGDLLFDRPKSRQRVVGPLKFAGAASKIPEKNIFLRDFFDCSPTANFKMAVLLYVLVLILRIILNY
jgi:hypothetical protein